MKKDMVRELFSEKKPARNAGNSVAGGEKVTLRQSERAVMKNKNINISVEAPENGKIGFFARFFDWIVKASILMVFFGLPIFFTGLNLQGVAFEKQMYFYFWTLLGLVAWAARGVVSESLRIKRTPLDIPIIVFLIAYILSFIFSVDRWHSFWGFFGDPSRGLMSVVAVVIFYYLFLSNFSEKLFRWALGAFIFSGSLVSVWVFLALMDKINFIPIAWKNVMPFSPLGSIGSLGIFFGLMVPLLLAVIFKIRMDEKANNILKNIFTAVIMAILVLNIILLWILHSYVLWPGLFLGMAFFSVLTLSKIVRAPASWTWLPMAVFVVILVAYLVGPLEIARVEIPAEISATFPSYKTSWEVAKGVLRDRLLFGSGPATYGYDFSLYHPQNFNLNNFYNLRFYQGTGMFFDSLSAMGILGAFSFLLVVISFLSISGYLLFKEREKNKIYSLGLLAASIIALADILAARMEGAIFLIGMLVGIAALAVIIKESGSEENYFSLTLKASAKFALTLAFVFIAVSAGVIFLFIFIGKAYTADIYAGIASKERSIDKLRKSINLFGKEGRYYTRLGQEYMVLANSEVLKKEEEKNIKLIQEYLNQAINNSKKGSDLMENDVRAREALAQVYENTGMITGDYKLAEDAYGKASELEPSNPDFPVKLGQIKLSMAIRESDKTKKEEIIKEAQDFFKKSIEKKENYSAGYYNLALTEEALGEIDKAVEDMSKAVSYERNINNVFALARLLQNRGGENDLKTAEALFKEILGVNDKEINTHFSLGMLYEKAGKKNQAVEEYEKVIDLLPADSYDAKKKIQGKINNLGSNAESLSAESSIGSPINDTSTGQ